MPGMARARKTLGRVAACLTTLRRSRHGKQAHSQPAVAAYTKSLQETRQKTRPSYTARPTKRARFLVPKHQAPTGKPNVGDLWPNRRRTRYTDAPTLRAMRAAPTATQYPSPIHRAAIAKILCCLSNIKTPIRLDQTAPGDRKKSARQKRRTDAARPNLRKSRRLRH
jgi:hypothetical protein